MKVEPRDQINPSWIEKYRPESHCDGRETSARLDSLSVSGKEPQDMEIDDARIALGEVHVRSPASRFCRFRKSTRISEIFSG